MNQGLIPKRYAKALFEVAVDRGDAEKLYGFMKRLSDAFVQQPALVGTMENPFVSDSDKAALIFTACQADSSDSIMVDFVRLLETNHRMGMVRQIAMAYEQIFRKSRNIYRVEVVSAAPLAPEEEDRLKSLILAHLDGGSMEYSSRIDPDLIGGFTVTIDNQRLDASVKNDLKQLRLKLLSNK